MKPATNPKAPSAIKIYKLREAGTRSKSKGIIPSITGTESPKI